MIHAALLAGCSALLAFSVFCITGRPDSVHVWWDRGDRDCFRCKMCGGCEFFVEGIHAQALHHPRLYKVGLGLAAVSIVIPVTWLALFIAQERRRPGAS